IVVKIERGARQVARRRLQLEKLRHDEPVGEDVRQPDVRQQQLAPDDPRRERIDAVVDQVRTARERRLEGRRAGSHDADVGGLERMVGVPVEQLDRQRLESHAIPYFVEVLARIAARERYQEAGGRQSVEELGGARQQQLAVHLELGQAAPREQRERRALGVELEQLARFAPARRGGG